MGILSSVIGLNPTALIAGGIAIAAISGGFVYQNHMIHKYHKDYLHDEKQVAVLESRIQDMVAVQQNQTKVTGGTVIQVIHVPGKTLTIVKTIHDAPEPANCGTPVLTQDEKDSF